MKIKIIPIAVFVMTIIAIPLVHGAVDWTLPYNNLSSGYRITTENFPDPVMLGDPVIAWAGTTNNHIEEVKFRWNPPEGSGLDSIVLVGTNEGYVDVPEVGLVYQWSSTYTPMDPDEIGDWGIQAVFYDFHNPGNGVGPIPEQPFPTEIRARSFFSIPEVPIGTIVILLAMFGALGVFAMKKRRITIPSKPM